MSLRDVAIVSTSALEPWDDRNPWTKGIGGSETSAIECATRLYKRGFDVKSFTPLNGIEPRQGLYPMPWGNSQSGDFDAGDYRVLINYRAPELFDAPKPHGAKWWFVSQDVDYGDANTEERRAKIDRYLCLCKTHARYILEKYPDLRGRVYISSNGIRSEIIRPLIYGESVRNPITGNFIKPYDRNPRRLFYASSPDRGIKLILENWFRIRERVPEAELVIAYGLDNMETIIRRMAGQDWRAGYAKELEALFQQDGVTFTGRIDQGRIYEEWLKSNICPILTDFPETNMICCQEAQALGAWPVANDLWAPGEFVRYGDLFQGTPQKSQVLLHTMLSTICDRLLEPPAEEARREMQEWALASFDWERTVTQWDNWLQEDLRK